MANYPSETIQTNHKIIPTQIKDNASIKTELEAISTTKRYNNLIQKNEKFTSQLVYKLKKTKEKKINKRKCEVNLNKSKTVADTWINDLCLTHEHHRTITSGEDLDDFIIYTAMSLLQKEFPSLMVQPPSLYRSTGYVYNPFETVQIVHNDAHHWLLLSSLNGMVTIYDSLNTKPTESLKRQMSQLFSPDDSLPQFQQVSCHKQTGSNDCGVFAIAYAVSVLHGISPDSVIFDQSKMRAHLVQCFQEGELKQFPTHRRTDLNGILIANNKSSSAWKLPRRSTRLAKQQVSPSTTTANRFELLNPDSADITREQTERDHTENVVEAGCSEDSSTSPDQRG